MSKTQSIDHNSSHLNQARKLLWPVALAVFLFTVSYPATDFFGAPSPTDIGLGLLLVYAGIAAVTIGVVFALVLPWALHHEGPGVVALALAIPGTLLAPGFWTGFPPGLAAGGALLGWGGFHATKARKLSRVAFVIGVLGSCSMSPPTRRCSSDTAPPVPACQGHGFGRSNVLVTLPCEGNSCRDPRICELSVSRERHSRL